MTTTIGRLPLLDENNRFPDRFTPQQVLDAEQASAGSATAAAGSAQSSSDQLAAMRAEYAGYRSDLGVKLDADQAGVPGGVAQLGGDGRLLPSQIPTSVQQYLGVWDATTNTPTLTDASGKVAEYFNVNGSGMWDLGSGSQDFASGDQVMHDGTRWQKLDNTDSVTRVAGKTGDVTLSRGDVGLGAVDNTADADKPISTAALAEFAKTIVSATVDGSGNLIVQTKDGGTLVAGYVKGPQGATGPANALTVNSVTKVAPGGQPTFQISGSAPSQTVDVGVVTGDTGAKGDSGDVAPSVAANMGTNLQMPNGSTPYTRVYTLTASCTLALPTAAPSSSISFTITFVFKQDATGSRTMTWPSGLKWAYGVKPTLSTAAGAIDVVHLLWTGVEWVGFVAGQAVA